MMIILEENIYKIIKERSEKEGISVPGLVRRFLISYFDLEDSTRDYHKESESSSTIITRGKTYYRINCKLEKHNEIYIKEELKKRKTSVNQLLKELILVTI